MIIIVHVVCYYVYTYIYIHCLYSCIIMTAPPEYDAVLKMYGEITELMRATPSMTQHISTQFKTNSWISITTKCSEGELITCALEKIKQDPSKNFKLFVDMLKATVGMRDIVNKLTK